MQGTITIPRPKKVPGTKKGVYSTGHLEAATARSRMSPYDLDLVDKAAVKCNLTRSAFLRWCSVWVAVEINKEEIPQAIQLKDYNF